MADGIVCQSGIYSITNTVNGKKYIGSAVNFDRRFKDHKKRLLANAHHSTKLQNSWLKHGAAAFVFEVIEYCCDHKLLIECEQKWIDKFHSFSQMGYNESPTAGSPLGVKHSEKSKSNMSAAAKKRGFCMDKIEAMRAANIGRKMSPDTRAKIAASKIGKPRTKECIDKMVASRADWKPTAEHLEKLRLANIGRRNSQESIEKQKATKKANRLAARLSQL